VAAFELTKHRASLFKGAQLDPNSIRRAEYDRRKSTVGTLSSLEDMENPLKEVTPRHGGSPKSNVEATNNNKS
jgi:hypothetical protein